MGLNTDQLKKGDPITVGRWIKKLGKFPVDNTGKSRNAYALCKKGKLVPAIKCKAEEADTIVNDGGSLVPFKRVPLDTTVKFAESVINVFPVAFWKKATTKNLFLGMLEEYQKEQKDGLDSELSDETQESPGESQ